MGSFAKVQSGSIGAVTIKNSVAYGNGYLEDGTDAGNGNGFKLGGDSMSGKHVLENCVAFDNKAKVLILTLVQILMLLIVQHSTMSLTI